MKTCRTCDFSGDESLFVNKANLCKKCNTLRIKTWRENNRDRYEKANHAYYAKNKDKMLAYTRARIAADREGHLQRVSEQKKRPDQRKKRAEYARKQAAEDPVHRLKRTLLSHVRLYLSQSRSKPGSRISQILGCDAQRFQAHMIETAQNRYGEFTDFNDYQIDHIIPQTQARSIEDVLDLFHYSNLQLLKPKDNLAKHTKLSFEVPHGNQAPDRGDCSNSLS